MSPYRVRDPETQWDQHRPPGHPRPRESKSQRAQLESKVNHGGSAAVKRGMEDKQGFPGFINSTPSSDDSLADTVQRALDQDKNLRGYGLEADVVEGIARVNGVVDSLAEKLHLRRVVTTIDGVTGYDDGVSISTDGAITDRGVEMEVGEELAAVSSLRDKVGVKVSGGTAFLMGHIDSPAEEKQAVSAASKARGVTAVVSQLKLHPRQALDPDDPESIFHSQVQNDREDGENYH